MARLEWLLHEAYHEADAAGLEFGALAAIPANAYGNLRFELHPSARLFESGYPILRILAFCQTEGEGEETLRLDEGGCHALIFRPALEVETIPFYTQNRHKLNIQSPLSLRERVRARAFKKFNLWRHKV
jgi:hypothetical protein